MFAIKQNPEKGVGIRRTIKIWQGLVVVKLLSCERWNKESIWSNFNAKVTCAPKLKETRYSQKV